MRAQRQPDIDQMNISCCIPPRINNILSIYSNIEPLKHLQPGSTAVSADTVAAGGGSERRGHSELRGKKHKQPQENHKTKMAVQETASQLSMALKVQEYPTLKVNRSSNWHMLIARRLCRVHNTRCVWWCLENVDYQLI